MKRRIILLLVLWLFFVSFQLISQAKQFIGYDKVAWGATVEEVRKIYSIPESIPLVVNEQSKDSNIKALNQEMVSESISKRRFLFIDNKLYKVWVWYSDVSENTANNLHNLLEKKYGSSTDYSSSTEKSTLMFETVYVTTNKTIFGKYVPDILVEIWQILLSYKDLEKDTNNLLGLNQLAVCYTWKKFFDDYQASKIDL